MSEETCENCAWASKFRQIWGHCRNPMNASKGNAGADYSSSDVLVPMSIKINQVCDLHESPKPTNLRNVYELEAYTVPNGQAGFAGYGTYDTKWRRKETN